MRLTQPDHRPAVWTVTRLDAEREFAWETRALGMRVLARHRLEPLGGGASTRVTLVIEVSGPTAFLFGPLVRKVSLHFLPQEAQGLKRICEAPTPGD